MASKERFFYILKILVLIGIIAWLLFSPKEDYVEEYNNSIKGSSKKSQHILGKAADISIKGLSPLEVYNVIERLIENGDMLQGGLGLYDSFIHYDIRGERARWDYQKKL